MDIVTVSTAAWLGILTAISPCPMATNIAAISLIGKEAGNKSKVLFSGLMYTLGRTLAYLTIGMLLSSGLTASSNISLFLQKYLNEALGPILIIIGMVLADMLNLRFKLSMQSDALQQKAIKKRRDLFVSAWCNIRSVILSGFSRIIFRSNDPVSS